MWLLLRTLWPAIPAFLITAALAFLLHNFDVNRIEAKQRQALLEQASQMQAQCDKEKSITKEVSRDYQNKTAALTRRLSELKRLRPSRCVPLLAAGTAAGRAPEAGAIPAGQNGGVTSDALYDFAGDAEKYRLQLIGCQDFIDKIWEGK